MTEDLVVEVAGGDTLVVEISGGIGPRGLSGTGGGSAFEFTQASASSTWTINHNLGYKPIISLYSVGGVVLLADIVHTSINQAVVSWAIATAGIARCV